MINNRELHDYFNRASYRDKVIEPFVATNSAGKFDVWCTAKGGGTTGT